MGKSPGKWIKTILFGKKPSKSSFLKKSTTNKEATIACKAVSGDLSANPSVVSDVALHTLNRIEENSEIGVTANLPHDAVVSMPVKQGAHTEGTMGLDSADSAEITRQEQAATKAQAAFKGYLARRAFRALKGIIRLQALIRGHLVRRQAVATLRCMQGIVKLQACIRGRKVRLSVCGLEVQKGCRVDVTQVEPVGLHTTTRPEKLSTNAFICKLLASLPTAMPLSLHYDPVEPNSAWDWLERWSSSQFWGPLSQPKCVPDAKSHRQQDSIQTRETQSSRAKRGVRKVPTVNVENNSLQPTSECEKPRRYLRKAMTHQAEPVQEQTPDELERVKGNLRKVAVSNSVASDRSEAMTEKPKINMRKVSSSTVSDAQKGSNNSSEKVNDPIVVVSKDSKLSEVELPPKPLALEATVDMIHADHPTGERLPLETVEKIDNIPVVNEELNTKEDHTSKENQKSRRRSFPAKQEYPENVSQNTPTLPKYMQATESAKAKLRAQGSPRFGQDEMENGFIRRHSLPASTNGKLSSMSPRVQRLAPANGKGGGKSDRSLSSFKDGEDKVARPGWRR
ncbi:hypothetical protein ACB098_01G285800 [Castanea mollissima]